MSAATHPQGAHNHPTIVKMRRRLARWELTHLRELAARQAEEIEDLVQRLHNEERDAEFWRESHHSLQDHLNDGTADARAIGLTVAGELLVVRAGCEGVAA